MEMEHIDDYSVRVLICAEDLEKRGINLADVIEDQRKSEEFFHIIIEEFNLQEKFENSEQVSFQLMPSVQFYDSVELVISSGASPFFQDPLLFLEQLKGLSYSEERFPSLSPPKKKPKREKKRYSLFTEEELRLEKNRRYSHFVVEFRKFDSVVDLVQTVKLPEGVATNLFEMNQKFYLHAFFDVEVLGQEHAADEKAKLLEFGTLTPATIEELAEHGRKLSKENAWQELENYFC